MTGYSFTTPVWEGGRWVVPAIAEVKAAPRANGPEGRPRDAPSQWDRIDWRAQEEQGRRARPADFKGGAGADPRPGRDPQEPLPRGPGPNPGRRRRGRPPHTRGPA